MKTNCFMVVQLLIAALVTAPLLAADVPAIDPANSDTNPTAETPVKIEALATQVAPPQTATPSAIASLPAVKKMPPARTTIKVAQSGDQFWYLPLYVAIDQGLFEKEGLEIVLVNTGDDARTVDAVMKG